MTHAEFLRAHADGRFYFLEVGARVGGGVIAGLVEAARGVNLWREWARLEVGNLRGEGYALPDAFEAYAGSVVCVAQDAGPDAGGFESSGDCDALQRSSTRAGLIVR